MDHLLRPTLVRGVLSLPRVDAVGVFEVPAGYVRSARTHSWATRLLAGTVLGLFVGVGVTTTVLSLGAYCLTSHASAAPALRLSDRVR